MNTKIISAIVIIAAMVAVIPAFMVPANAQFNTNNSIGDKTVTQTQTANANGGTGGNGGVSVGGSANGGSANGGTITQSQGFCEQNAQSGAFGSSSNRDVGIVRDSGNGNIGKDCS
jgi:hypothetical protein